MVELIQIRYIGGFPVTFDDYWVHGGNCSAHHFAADEGIAGLEAFHAPNRRRFCYRFHYP